MRPHALRLALLATLALAPSACAVVGNYGAPSITPEWRGYWIWHDGTRWHLWATPHGHPHRFHGSINTTSPREVGPRLRAAPVTLETSNPQWHDGAHQDEQAISFDVTTDQPGGLSWIGRYAQFDIAIDGIYRPLRVRLGPSETHPTRVPFTIDSP